MIIINRILRFKILDFARQELISTNLSAFHARDGEIRCMAVGKVLRRLASTVTYRRVSSILYHTGIHQGDLLGVVLFALTVDNGASSIKSEIYLGYFER